jgi:putative hemolysin
MDQDAYDTVCEHLLVEEKVTEAAGETQAEVELLRSTACRETVYEAALAHARG